MEDGFEPYITHYEGDAITAGDSNKKQVMIKEDIAARVQEAIDNIEKVPAAENADKLEQKSFEELKQEILDAVLLQVQERSGYQMLFKVLRVGEEHVVEHNLSACPLVDVYQLDYFPVVATEDGYRFLTWVNFYLYQSGEKRVRFKEEVADTSTLVTVDTEPRDGHAYRIPFKDMLELYDVQYDDNSSLDDLETEFWQKFCADPNDEFDDDQHAHSPWFDRCCRDHESVGRLKKQGSWDDIWFQMRPRKTINYPMPPPTAGEADGVTPAPTQVGVYHFDFNTLGLRLLRNPINPPERGLHPDPDIANPDEPIAEIADDVLKVMVLLKV